ncbi:M23 family metallopeptidase, partial [Candidatus Peregrinibacteria bacterium]|nr:M23 family metallopeptidase [Candidatus Peregrinibacteria bacterium]
GTCQSVYAGQMIGLSGNTGNSFGAHLHFEIRHNGAFENPWRWLP